MKVISNERATGMGAHSFAAILDGDRWITVSHHPRAVHLGRNHGWEQYEVEVPDCAVFADFHRSNSGKETVHVYQGDERLEFLSFAQADAWATAQSVETVIVTRHTGLVAWLAEKGITGAVIAQATPDDVRGKHVIGALPLHLSVLAERVTVVDLPGLTAEQRGQDLTPAEMDAAGARLTAYRVVSLS